MKEKKIDVSIILTSVILTIVAVIVLLAYTDKTIAVVDTIWGLVLTKTTSILLIGALFILIFMIWLGFSKYGNIRLGSEKPEFSKWKVFVMIFSATYGASAMYWCMTEAMFYYEYSFYGEAARSAVAAEWALAYNFMHWGPTSWALYPMCAIPVVYTFYLRKKRSLKLSDVCNELYDGKTPKWGRKLIDTIYILSCFGACAISLGLSIPMIAKLLSGAFGLQESLVLNIGIIIAIALVFSFSSYLGLGKGMANLSVANAWVFIAFLVFVLFVNGPILTLDRITNSLGLLFNNYIRMSLWTDPIGGGGFPQSWTAFYWVYVFIFAPGMGIFIARIMKGYTIKEMVWLSLIFGSLGCFAMHGICQTYAINTELSGVIPIADMINSGLDNEAIVAMLQAMPFGTMALIAFTIVALLFMATTVDSNSFTLATLVSYKLDKEGNPSPLVRLLWCGILAAIPLALTIIKAPMNTLKTIAFIVAIPLGIILAVMTFKTMKLLKKDYGNKSKGEIAELFTLNK